LTALVEFREMHESTTYEMILDEGRLKQAKKVLLRLGEKRFGPPSEAVAVAINQGTDLERSERMLDRILLVASWQELLATP
jgi:hypothetical protein